jgi:hypothetical protein
MGAGTKRNWNAKAILFLLSKTNSSQSLYEAELKEFGGVKVTAANLSCAWTNHATSAHQKQVFPVVIKLNFHVALHKSTNHVDFNIL